VEGFNPVTLAPVKVLDQLNDLFTLHRTHHGLRARGVVPNNFVLGA
jgi:hypothetical protein